MREYNSHKSSKVLSLIMVTGLALLLLLIAGSSRQTGEQTTVTGLDFSGDGIRFARPFANERPPRDDFVAAQAAGVALGDTAQDMLVLERWYDEFQGRKKKAGPNPRAYEKRLADLSAAQILGMSPNALGLGEIGEAQMLMIPFEFAGEDTIDTCDNTGKFVGKSTVEGPLHGAIPDPSLDGDNNSLWTDDFSIEWYEKLIFGDGVGVVRKDLNGGEGVDLSGVSARNWYLEQSEGLYDLQGEIYPRWVQLDHSVAWYGWGRGELNPERSGYPCDGLPSGFGFEFVGDIIDKLNATNPDFDWARWDTDDDQIVDHFMVIHAGVDNSAGGGEYGNYQIWAHSWDVRTRHADGSYTSGYLADDGGTPADPDDDIYVLNYTTIPEDADIGVVVHEYGHDIGLPDYYDGTGATSNSAAQWIAMASGSWSGALGGSHPASFNPWARYFFGWADPKVIAFDDVEQSIKIGQSEPTPEGSEDSVWITLPDQVSIVNNLAGEGDGLHAKGGDAARQRLSREFDLSEAKAPVFSFDASFSIEEDWDFVYVSLSPDGGRTWSVPLLNEEGVFAARDENGSPAWWGPGGLTGAHEGRLTYDVSAYAGESRVVIAIDYVTDHTEQGSGIWIDNIALDDGERSLYANDMADSSDWTNSSRSGLPGWDKVPNSVNSSHYYMLEWRNDQGSIGSEGHGGQYYSLAHAGDGWLVDKFAANVPGLLIWYRNTRYGDNNAVSGGREFAPPATGPKGELLLVDSHYGPIVWSGGWWDSAAEKPAAPFSNRRGAMDGAFTLYDTPPWKIHDYADSARDVFDFGSRSAVSVFHDSMRSVPGWVIPDLNDTFVYRADRDASVVIPGADYTTRIRGLADDGVTIGDDVPALWGALVGGQEIGSGNPGDSGSHYGVHVQLVQQAADGSYAVVNFHNSLFESAAEVNYGGFSGAGGQWQTVDQEATAVIRVQNVGNKMENALIVVEAPDNVDVTANSLDEGLVGVSRKNASDVADAAQYIVDQGFEKLLEMPQPDDIGFIAANETAFPNSAWTTLTFDTIARRTGSVTPHYLILHADGSLNRPLAELTVKINYQESLFLPLLRGG